MVIIGGANGEVRALGAPCITIFILLMIFRAVYPSPCSTCGARGCCIRWLVTSCGPPLSAAWLSNEAYFMPEQCVVWRPKTCVSLCLVWSGKWTSCAEDELSAHCLETTALWMQCSSGWDSFFWDLETPFVPSLRQVVCVCLLSCLTIPVWAAGWVKIGHTATQCVSELTPNPVWQQHDLMAEFVRLDSVGQSRVGSTYCDRIWCVSICT